MNNSYSVLKAHFDKLFVGGYKSNGFERIRDVYERAFNKPIHMYDVYETNLKIIGNPISKIITLVGPDDDIPSGIMPCVNDNDIAAVSVIPEKYLTGVNKSNVNDYVSRVFSAMQTIIELDVLGNRSDSFASNNPYSAFLKFCPYYFTFRHIQHHFPDLVNENIFKEILEKYYCAEDDIDKVFESIKNTAVREDNFNSIYSAMTCKNTVELFY